MKPTLQTSLIAMASAALAAQAGAAVVLSTDLTDRDISTTTASMITYGGDGSVTSGNITGSTDFSTDPTTSGYLVPLINTDTAGEWTITVPFNLTVTSLEINSVTLTGAMFRSGTSAFQDKVRDTNVRVSFIGSTSGTLVVGTETVTNPGGPNTNNIEAYGLWTTEPTYTPVSSLVLSNAETWTLQIETVSRSGSGNFTGLSGFSVDATVPEPGSLALLGLGGLLIARRRRA